MEKLCMKKINIMSTLYTQGTNNNKYEESGKHGLSVEKNWKSSSNCFC
jgi:hypothetical protein